MEELLHLILVLFFALHTHADRVPKSNSSFEYALRTIQLSLPSNLPPNKIKLHFMNPRCFRDLQGMAIVGERSQKRLHGTAQNHCRTGNQRTEKWIPMAEKEGDSSRE